MLQHEYNIANTHKCRVSYTKWIRSRIFINTAKKISEKTQKSFFLTQTYLQYKLAGLHPTQR